MTHVLPSTNVVSVLHSLTVDKIHREISKPLHNLRIIVLLCNTYDIHQAQIKIDESCPTTKTTWTDIPVLTSPDNDCQIKIVQCFDQSSDEDEDEDDYSSLESWEEKVEEDWLDWNDEKSTKVLENDEQCTLHTPCKICCEEMEHLAARSEKISETKAHVESNVRAYDPFNMWMTKSKYRFDAGNTTLLTTENAIGETFRKNENACPFSAQGALRMWREVVSQNC
jgi:hypothetical protein